MTKYINIFKVIGDEFSNKQKSYYEQYKKKGDVGFLFLKRGEWRGGD